jgi:hypothetical protein
MNGYITVQEAAKKWAVTDRLVQQWCKDEKIPGAKMLSRIWIIPEKSERPVPARNKVERGG